jgi:hypothetical protein
MVLPTLLYWLLYFFLFEAIWWRRLDVEILELFETYVQFVILLFAFVERMRMEVIMRYKLF